MQIWMSCLGKTKTSMVKQPGGGEESINIHLYHGLEKLIWFSHEIHLEPSTAFYFNHFFSFSFLFSFWNMTLTVDFVAQVMNTKKQTRQNPLWLGSGRLVQGMAEDGKWEVFQCWENPSIRGGKDFEESGCPATLSSYDLFEMVNEVTGDPEIRSVIHDQLNDRGNFSRSRIEFMCYRNSARIGRIWLLVYLVYTPIISVW